MRRCSVHDDDRLFQRGDEGEVGCGQRILRARVGWVARRVHEIPVGTETADKLQNRKIDGPQRRAREIAIYIFHVLPLRAVPPSRLLLKDKRQRRVVHRFLDQLDLASDQELLAQETEVCRIRI